ncbi:hypothetical protein Cs7R123_63930 [Catellatospora sp. TT07R-123]|uniref:DUF4194 domain-containing protein n=1 Tax=Catellatospora sp. TT07R-123 TaxID=2733863 RepID=UPI001AFEA1C3|nr:DUF4194 domain-containing protein [Catellatospora sp. TT07R-123]GHJ49051.1 hypothetical protein Cs7R123_63930 [Catellatospora sp. TT07R-123]
MAEEERPLFEQVFGEDLFDDDGRREPAVLDAEAMFAEGLAASVGVLVDSGVRQPRFDGDASELPAEVCWTLQELVAAPHVTEKSRKHWAVVQQYEDVLRSRLSELNLILEVNREHRYAFTRQAFDPSPHSRAILRSKTLSLAASALALYLYQQYVMSPDEPVVETADMIDHMMAYKPSGDTDEAGFLKKVRTAITALDDAAIIKPVRGADRYIIYPVITSILTAEQVDALTDKYQAIAGGQVRGSDAEQEPADD